MNYVEFSIKATQLATILGNKEHGKEQRRNNKPIPE